MGGCTASCVAEHTRWLEELERGEGGREDDYLALYFGLIAGGLYFMGPELGIPMGFTLDRPGHVAPANVV